MLLLYITGIKLLVCYCFMQTLSILSAEIIQVSTATMFMLGELVTYDPL